MIFVMVFDPDLSNLLTTLGWKYIRSSAYNKGNPVDVFKVEDIEVLNEVDDYKYILTSRITV